MKKHYKLTIIGFLFIFTANSKNCETVMHFNFGETKAAANITQITKSSIYTEAVKSGIVPFANVYTNSTTQKKHYLSSNKAFYFNTQLPEGHYTITLTLGGNPEGSSTTVKAESRRLMFENLVTKPGETIKKTIVVDVRNTKINDTASIKLKSRELDYLNWDNKLTLEFTGKMPCVSSITIKKTDNITTIFLAGNSTVTDQEYEPWASWGQMFTNFLKPNVVVANYAESGETLLAFKRENRLIKILSQMKKADYLFMEFAHNDQKAGGNHLDAYTTYKDELKYYINETRKKGGIPVLVTSTNRRRFDENGKIVNTLENYPDAMRQLAKEENVAIIDLNAMSKDFYEALGPENSKKAFVHYAAKTYPGQDKALADDTHFNPYGAYELAKCIVQNILSQNLSLKKYISKDWVKFNPQKPDAYADFYWFESPVVETQKPDGN